MRSTPFLFAVMAILASPESGAQGLRILSETGTPSLITQIKQELQTSETTETLFEARRQARRSAQKAEDYLNSIGFFAPEIAHAVEPGPPPTIQLRIEPGPKFTFASVTIETSEAELSAEAASALPH